MQKKDEKRPRALEEGAEIKPDDAESLNALATLYNNQKHFDEAAAIARQGAAPPAAGRQRRRTYNQGIILWNAGKIAEAKVSSRTPSRPTQSRRRPLPARAWRS